MVGRAFCPRKTSGSPPPSQAVTTDASHSGWGASWGNRQLSGSWSVSVNERDHINVLELRAIFLALSEWAPVLRGVTVAIHCDNKTAVSYILKEGGTRSHSLMMWARCLLTLVDRWGIQLRPAYLPGMANLEADALSRGKKVEEWSILPGIAKTLFRVWGRPRVDLFASHLNAVVPSYFSISKGDFRAIG